MTTFVGVPLVFEELLGYIETNDSLTDESNVTGVFVIITEVSVVVFVRPWTLETIDWTENLIEPLEFETSTDKIAELLKDDAVAESDPSDALLEDAVNTDFDVVICEVACEEIRFMLFIDDSFFEVAEAEEEYEESVLIEKVLCRIGSSDDLRKLVFDLSFVPVEVNEVELL